MPPLQVSAGPRVTVTTALAAFGWLLAWQLVLAPAPVGTVVTVLALLPFAACVPGLLRGSRRARQWLSLIMPWYFALSLVSALTAQGRDRVAACIATLLLLAAFSALLLNLRGERTQRGAAATRAATDA